VRRSAIQQRNGEKIKTFKEWLFEETVGIIEDTKRKIEKQTELITNLNGNFNH
jgi:hypothetical protein